MGLYIVVLVIIHWAQSKKIITFYNIPAVKQYTRDYYKCSTLPGMLVETNGINGTSYSHYSRTLAYNELMTGSSIFDYRAITNFTLKLLDDTGWYKVDY